MQKLKSYFIADALKRISDDPFEEMKLELIFNLLIFWIPISILPIIPLIIEEYWLMISSTFITTIGSSIALYYLKKTNSYVIPSHIWIFTCLIGLFIMHFVGGGLLRGIDILWITLAIIASFVLLGSKLGLYSFIINSILIIWSTLIYLNFLPPHQFIIFDSYQSLFRHPTIISALVPLFTIGYTLYSFFKAQEKAQKILHIQKKKLNNKKERIEIIQKETEDSIYYAKRIQSTMLTPLKIVKQSLNTSFILYEPKSIVSGDFYWVQKINDTVYFAVADCTGHGVPGAMLSVICMNALTLSIKGFDLRDPGEILDKTRHLIINKLNKGSEEIKDGMDISLCALNTKNNSLCWAGANNPLWIIRGQSNKIEITSPNKQPVGQHVLKKSFDSHIIQLYKNDMIYLTSDGFADQFGGNQGKKYKTVQLRKKLIELSDKEINLQHYLLKLEFERWKGKLEQLDDVCIMGVRV